MGTWRPRAPMRPLFLVENPKRPAADVPPETMTDDQPAEASEAHVDDAVIERAADRFGVDPSDLRTALVVLYGDLLGRHSDFESENDYVTVDETRAYRVPEAAWTDLLGASEIEADDLADAVVYAHTEQARLVFEDAVGVDERFADDERGVVVGIDTAEEF